MLPELPGLIIKSLFRLKRILGQAIEEINLEKFLVAIHEYLSSIDHVKKTQNDDLGEKLVKTLIIEVVKLKQDKI